MRTEDGHIVQECLNGEPGAFGILVDKYKEGIYAFAYDKLRNFQDAQDVTQEVFLQAYRGLPSLRRWESLAFWLYRIAYARCADLLRIRSRRVDRDFIEDQDPAVMDAPSLNLYRRNQLNESVWEALEALPGIYREVLTLHYFGGMTIRDIAGAIGVSPSAVGKRLSRGRAQLKEKMISMMDTAFEGQRLPSGFTFRIVEIVKRTKMKPTQRTNGVPWGLSMTAGLMIAAISISSYLNLFDAAPVAMLLPSETRVLEVGEIPVNILKISQTPIIADGKIVNQRLGKNYPVQQMSAIAQQEANKAFMLRYFEAGSGKAKPAEIMDQYISDSDQALKDHVAMFEAGFPLYEMLIDDMIAEGDKVAVRITFHGTHQGDFAGIPSTGVEVTVTVNLIYRIADDMVVEHWMEADQLALMQQLGVIAPGRPSPENYTWGNPSEVTGAPGDPAANKAILVRFIEEVWNQGKLDMLDEITSTDIVAHSPAEPGSPIIGIQANRQTIAAYRSAFPDLHITMEHTLVEGDKVVTRWTSTGTHQGEFMGIPPTGRQTKSSGIIVSRIADGKIVENWWAWDALGLMQQLTKKEQ